MDVLVAADPLLAGLDDGLPRDRLIGTAGVAIVVVGAPLTAQLLGGLLILQPRPDPDVVVTDKAAPMASRLTFVVMVLGQIHFLHYGGDAFQTENNLKKLF